MRSRLALVPQDSTLFLRTLRENLNPQGLHTDAELISILQRAWLLPRDGPSDNTMDAEFSLDSTVGDEGANFSAGEKQLLALCRALVKNSKIIVLDEAMSSIITFAAYHADVRLGGLDGLEEVERVSIPNLLPGLLRSSIQTPSLTKLNPVPWPWKWARDIMLGFNQNVNPIDLIRLTAIEHLVGLKHVEMKEQSEKASIILRIAGGGGPSCPLPIAAQSLLLPNTLTLSELCPLLNLHHRTKQRRSRRFRPCPLEDMLDNSQNVLVTGGTFTHVEQHGMSGFVQLHAAIADGAMHDSGERFDPPKCYPGTREVVLKQLLDWVITHDGEAFMHRVQGTAGGGKSAILQEIAELCAKQKRLIASFFFSWTAVLRNNEKRAIENDPAVLTKSLDSQLLSLVIAPLDQAYCAAGEERLHWPRLILLDGLDECGEGPVLHRLLSSLVTRVAECKFPLLLLVSSRPEIHLVTTFNQTIFKGKVSVTVLDENYKPDEDIRRFLEGTFQGIKENHPLRSYLPSNWPSAAAMDHLIWKSSGHFIYAATVARYVSPPDCHPAQCLDVVLRIQTPTGHESPFAELDALYFHILSSLPDDEISLHILALVVFPHIYDPYRTTQYFDLHLRLRGGFPNKSFTS
ncbi:unnamed protein product [Cyclocybe aegerita]|uniref:NACHT domain-containing protein n=1 Tax=Cyclocybe aegerita TaxID=1973307 RepID=A0A8S0W0L2_CYCAE|nr:unnamed protein product [Cyclocybe aegerita]